MRRGTVAGLAALAGALCIVTSASVGAIRAPRAHAAVIDSRVRSCVAVWSAREDEVWQSDRRACSTRLSPASTFKIPHALVALTVGAVAPATIERWDGTPYPAAAAWERDYTVLTALKPSVVWFFQRLAPRVGAARMADWLRRLGYGNARADGEITMYWLNGTLQVSPVEQVEVLRRFYAGQLPLNADTQRLVRDALDQPPATIENSRGVTRLAGAWTQVTRWNAKTGRTEYAGREVSWLVGQLSTRSGQHVFAAAVWRDRGAVGFLDAAHLAVETLTRRGVLR